MYSYRVRKAANCIKVLVMVAVGVLGVGLITSYANGFFGMLAPQDINISSLEHTPAHAPAAGDDEPDDAPDTQEIITEMLSLEEPVRFGEGEAGAPHVLIYQTHTEEAYTMAQEGEYVEAAKWRTADNYNNIVRVGNALATQLSGVHGIPVLHDATNYERPKLGTSYNRSLAGIMENKKNTQSLNVFIDVHRDAYNKNNTPMAVEIDGKKVARVMLVVGKGTEFSDPPDWEANLAFAQRVCDYLAEVHPDLSRGVSVKTGRYNQHVSDHSLLIEVGHNENTLEEALNATGYIAQAIQRAILDFPVQ